MHSGDDIGLAHVAPPAGLTNPDPLAALRVGDVQDHTPAHPKEVAALLAVSLALVDPFDGERIGERLDRFVKGNAVTAQILGRLRVAPLSRQVIRRCIRFMRIFIGLELSFARRTTSVDLAGVVCLDRD